MKPKEIAFVCYGVDDITKSRDFYENVLMLTPGSTWISDDGKMGFIEYEMGPHTLAIGSGAPNFSPGKSGATAAIEVENFNEAVKSLKEKGVKFLMEPHENNSCWMGLIEDPSENQIMIHMRKQK